jgi:DeoR/GlpR family transcriptional regulator of sugar metabolism
MAKRHTTILELLAREGAVRVVELAALFDVDASTIRRDLKRLETQAKLRRVHGGAVALEASESALPGVTTTSQEMRIGRAVVKMFKDGETVFLSSGRLALGVARGLQALSQLTVVTNGLDVAHWVATNTSHTLIVTGGQVATSDLGLVGQLTRQALSSLRADRVVVALDGISAVGGLTADDLAQAEVVQVLLEIGSEVIALVSAERVGRVAAVYIAPVSDVDVVVTAREASAPFLWDLSETGVRVVLA